MSKPLEWPLSVLLQKGSGTESYFPDIPTAWHILVSQNLHCKGHHCKLAMVESFLFLKLMSFQFSGASQSTFCSWLPSACSPFCTFSFEKLIGVEQQKWTWKRLASQRHALEAFLLHWQHAFKRRWKAFQGWETSSNTTGNYQSAPTPSHSSLTCALRPIALSSSTALHHPRKTVTVVACLHLLVMISQHCCRVGDSHAVLFAVAGKALLSKS